MPLLEVDSINVFYGSIQALRGVSLKVEAGERVALLGPNGAGKSTTLRTISGLLSPGTGSIVLDGESIGGLPAHAVVGKGVTQGPEGRALFPTLSVEENLRFGYLPRRKDKKGYEPALERVFSYFPRLEERRKQSAGTLSGGEQQMLVVARALMSSPRLLMVDELSLGLAPKIVALLFEIIREVNAEGTAVLIVEQFVHMALANTDRAYVLAKGEVVLEGKSSELSQSKDLLSSYLGDETETEDSEGAGGQETPREQIPPQTAPSRDLPASLPSESENGPVPESTGRSGTRKRPRSKRVRAQTSKSSRSSRKAKAEGTETRGGFG